MDRITERIESSAIERTIPIDADRATVFRYWTEAELLAKWMGRRATVEPRDGTFRVDYNGTDVASGMFEEVASPARLVLTWGREAPGDSVPPGSSRVEVDFVEDGGSTVVTVRHVGSPVDSLDSHAEGWDHFLPPLREALARG